MRTSLPAVRTLPLMIVADLLAEALTEILLVAALTVIRERHHQDRVPAEQHGCDRPFQQCALQRPEARRVAALRHLDYQFVFLALFTVVTRQLRAQTPRLHPYDGIVPRVERRVLAEHLHPHRKFLETVAASRKRLRHHEAEEALQPVGLSERFAGQNPVELP
jgi:hypothetical protein